MAAFLPVKCSSAPSAVRSVSLSSVYRDWVWNGAVSGLNLGERTSAKGTGVSPKLLIELEIARNPTPIPFTMADATQVSVSVSSGTSLPSQEAHPHSQPASLNVSPTPVPYHILHPSYASTYHAIRCFNRDYKAHHLDPSDEAKEARYSTSCDQLQAILSRYYCLTPLSRDILDTALDVWLMLGRFTVVVHSNGVELTVCAMDVSDICVMAYPSPSPSPSPSPTE
ncbi:hypothetical protein NMY22_g2120 [Coprinellus aureogranulatus]|nr:hypothetical protein NMY22_g2120 [Coprinellus aureogranulatus]